MSPYHFLINMIIPATINNIPTSQLSRLGKTIIRMPKTRSRTPIQRPAPPNTPLLLLNIHLSSATQKVALTTCFNYELSCLVVVCVKLLIEVAEACLMPGRRYLILILVPARLLFHPFLERVKGEVLPRKSRTISAPSSAPPRSKTACRKLKRYFCPGWFGRLSGAVRLSY